MAGETSSHSFEVPFPIDSNVVDYDVLYRLGLENVIIKGKDELSVTPSGPNDSFSTITCKLTPDETNLFANTLLSCHVQLRFVMGNGATTFTEVYPVRLLDSLYSRKAG